MRDVLVILAIITLVPVNALLWASTFDPAAVGHMLQEIDAARYDAGNDTIDQN